MNRQNTVGTMAANDAALDEGVARNGSPDIPDNIRDALRLVAAALRRTYRRHN